MSGSFFFHMEARREHGEHGFHTETRRLEGTERHGGFTETRSLGRQGKVDKKKTALGAAFSIKRYLSVVESDFCNFDKFNIGVGVLEKDCSRVLPESYSSSPVCGNLTGKTAYIHFF